MMGDALSCFAKASLVLQAKRLFNLWDMNGNGKLETNEQMCAQIQVSKFFPERGSRVQGPG